MQFRIGSDDRFTLQPVPQLVSVAHFVRIFFIPAFEENAHRIFTDLHDETGWNVDDPGDQIDVNTMTRVIFSNRFGPAGLSNRHAAVPAALVLNGSIDEIRPPSVTEDFLFQAGSGKRTSRGQDELACIWNYRSRTASPVQNSCRGWNGDRIWCRKPKHRSLRKGRCNGAASYPFLSSPHRHR